MGDLFVLKKSLPGSSTCPVFVEWKRQVFLVDDGTKRALIK